MLKAGFARIDITPGRDCSLLGYEFRQQELPPGNAGVHDPLHARALVLASDDGAPAVLVSCDLCILTVPMARLLRSAIAEAAHTTPDRVILATTHTHSGPFPNTAETAGHRGFLTTFAGDEARHPDAEYTELLQQRLREAAASAAGLLVPVTVSVQQAPLGIAYDRRVMTPDGLRHCWNPQESPELQPGPAPDPTCVVLGLRQPGGPRQILLWSVAAHAVVLGKTSRVVSADWPGRACELLEGYIPGARSVFLQGASGDCHPWVATQEDPAQIEPVARAAASGVALLAEALRQADEPVRLKTAVRTVTIGKAEMDLAAWAIGPAVLAAVPVELFGRPAMDLRRRTGRPLLLATCGNGWTGYWPEADVFDQGGYEINAARHMGRSPGDTERLIDELASLIEGLG